MTPYKMQVIRESREQFRNAIACQWSMNHAEAMWRSGRMREQALERFERIFAWGTATEHPKTNHVPLERWKTRRERIHRAIKSHIAKEARP